MGIVILFSPQKEKEIIRKTIRSDGFNWFGVRICAFNIVTDFAIAIRQYSEQEKKKKLTEKSIYRKFIE